MFTIEMQVTWTKELYFQICQKKHELAVYMYELVDLPPYKIQITGEYQPVKNLYCIWKQSCTKKGGGDSTDVKH